MDIHRRSQPLALLAAMAVALGCSIWWPGAPARASNLRRTAIVAAIEQAKPSVVNIQGRKVIRAEQDESGSSDPFRQVNGMGTGIVIDHRGYILTNYHVVENVEVIQVTLADKRGFVAQLVSNDPVSDLAVIKIDADDDLPVITIGTSSDLLHGEPVIAVGNAFGYGHTVADGIISALHREVQVSATQSYHDLIQTNAAINPGNSGGPLLNIDGQMIGINVAVRVGAQNIGFAIPVDEAIEIAARLLNVEQIDQLVHGMVGETRISGAEPRFVLRSVRPGSSAADCGLQPGDVITAVDQTPVQRALDVERALIGRGAGQPVAIDVQRDGQPQTVELVLAALPPGDSNQFGDRTWQLLGMKLSPVPKSENASLFARYRGGMRIDAIRPDGPAANQGIRPGDVLVGMHVWETISPDNVLYVVDHAEFERFQPVKFYIVRGGETLYGHMRLKRDAVVQVSRSSTERR
jgi:serine protease Do